MKFCHCILGGTKACAKCSNNNIIYGENSTNPGTYDLTKNIEEASKTWSGIDTDKWLSDLRGRA